MTDRNHHQKPHELAVIDTKKLRINKLDGNDYKIDFYGVDNEALVFDDRPFRFAQGESIAEFLSKWGNGSRHDNPNVVLSYRDHTTGNNVELSMEMGKPYYNKSLEMLTFYASESPSQSKVNRVKNFVESDPSLQKSIYGLEGSMFIDSPINTEDVSGEVADLGVLDGDNVRIQQRSDDTYMVSIEDVDDELLLFTNSPYREANYTTTSRFISKWDSNFGDVNPNVVLSYYDHQQQSNVNFAFEMSAPRYDSSSGILHFEAIESKAQSIANEDWLTGLPLYNASSHTGSGASLFIDSLSWPCIDLVGLTALKIINTTPHQMTVNWTSKGNETGFPGNPILLSPGDETRWMTGENCDDFDVAARIYLEPSLSLIKVDEFWAQQPNFSQAWVSNQQGSEKLFGQTRCSRNCGQYVDEVVHRQTKVITEQDGKEVELDYNWQLTFAAYPDPYIYNDPIDGTPINSYIRPMTINYMGP